MSFPAPPDISAIVDAWAAHDLIKRRKCTGFSRDYKNAAGFGTRELFRSWHIRITWSVLGLCRIEGFAQRRHLDWLVPKEIPLDVSALDDNGYSGAADEGRKQLNRLLAMLGQPSIPSHREA